MTTLKKNVKDLTEYYYQWMCKHKDDADRRLELLEEALRVIQTDWTDDNPRGYRLYVETKLVKKIEKEWE